MSDALPENSQWICERCDGYMDLSMWTNAKTLLDTLPDDDLEHPIVLRLLERLAHHEQNWDLATSLSQQLLKLEPSQVQHWIGHAYATRRSNGLDAAKKILTDALSEFSHEPIIHYNLACYDCVQGQQEDAIKRLTLALKISPDILQLIEQDEDLVSVRDFFDDDDS